MAFASPMPRDAPVTTATLPASTPFLLMGAMWIECPPVISGVSGPILEAGAPAVTPDTPAAAESARRCRIRKGDGACVDPPIWHPNRGVAIPPCPGGAG